MAESWEEVTIAAYEPMALLHNRTETPSTLEILKAITGLPIDVVYRIPVEYALEITELYNNLKPEDLNHYPMLTGFSYKGEEYKIRPNIGFESIGDYEDWRVFKDELRKDQYIRCTVAFWCRREAEMLDPQTLDSRIDHFADLPITVAYALAGFFLHKRQKLSLDLEDLGRLNNLTRTLFSKSFISRLVDRVFKGSVTSGRYTDFQQEIR